MQTTRMFLALALVLGALVPSLAPAADAPGKIRVLIVTGGHEYEKDPFFQVFRGQPDISYIAVEHPKAYDQFKSEAAAKFDVILLYDMYQGLTEAAKADFLALLKDGKGLLVMHHAIANYQKWPEYAKIIGARYYLEPTTVDGVEKKRSTSLPSRGSPTSQRNPCQLGKCRSCRGLIVRPGVRRGAIRFC